MKRNCNLELQLVTPSSVFSRSSDNNGRYMNTTLDEERPNKITKPLTIFYNGRVASCDATELQAREIIFLASKEMEKKSNSGLGLSPYPSPLPNSPISSPTLKTSLKRFLEKRKTRAQSVNPCTNIRHNTEN
ncbi:jasmonate Zim-domain protein [Striga asiatica]|uniref:Protein TIFY n=1 Tax=Striga asiatica TaxID=4170 RepID=A0A5A7PW51_STRAF|nr:jasmonate Zim-domain protein [Striga asiatica]